MPLILPSMDSKNQSGEVSDWENKLLGKTLHDGDHTETAFAKKDLPQKHRVIEEGGASTLDMDPDRINVIVSRDGIVKKVTKG